MTSTRSADGAALPRGKRRARKLKTVTFSLDDLLAGLVSRQRLEDEIDRLIGILDAADPDPDLEETGDLEPSLGAYCPGAPYDGELDKADDEPSLGSFDWMADQSNWSRVTDAAACAGEDAELDEADREYSGGESRPGADDASFPRVLRNTAATAAATADACRQLDELAARMAGLDGNRDQRRSGSSICNVIPLGISWEVRP